MMDCVYFFFFLWDEQSEMEKNVRKSRQEVRERDNEITKLKDVRDQYVKTIEEMQDVIRQHEAASASGQKQMSGRYIMFCVYYVFLIQSSTVIIVMQAVSQASQDKISKLEAEISTIREELTSQRRALESSWSDNSELKRTISEIQAEKDELRGKLGQGPWKYYTLLFAFLMSMVRCGQSPRDRVI